MITAEALFKHLAEGFPVGMVSPLRPVVRFADGKPVHHGHVARADGAWRVYIFADPNDPTGGNSHFRQLASSSSRTPLRSTGTRRPVPTLTP